MNTGGIARRDWLLMFAYHFPPDNAIGGIRPALFQKYLSRSGTRCRVITASAGAPRINPDACFIPDPWFSDPPKGSGWQIERALRKIFWPGMTGMQWAARAISAAQKMIRETPASPAAIYSTFPPFGAHIAGWELRRREKLPWIADFRDPLGDMPGWETNSLHNASFRWAERRVVSAAEALVVNTDRAAERLCTLYPREKNKIHLISNGFDPEDRSGPLPLPHRPFLLISHVGELYGGRNAGPLLESFGRVIATGRVPADRVRVLQVGDVRHGSVPGEDFISKSRAWLEFAPQCDRSEARRITATSDRLLLIQPHTTTQVPGKLYEYLQIGRPILAYIPRNSAIEPLLAHSGIPYRCVYADAGAASMDETVAEFLLADFPQETQPSSWFEDNFNAMRQTQALSNIIDSLPCARI